MQIWCDHTWKNQSLRSIARLQARWGCLLPVSPSVFFSQDNPGIPQKNTPFSLCFFQCVLKVFFKKKSPFLLSSFFSLPRLQYVLPPPILSLFLPIYITPQDLNLFLKRKILQFPFFFSSFLNLPIKSNLPNFKFPSKTFQGESHLP